MPTSLPLPLLVSHSLTEAASGSEPMLTEPVRARTMPRSTANFGPVAEPASAPASADFKAQSSCARDVGATSLAVTLLTPVFIGLAFAAWQAALWSHARTEARVVARDTAALVARSTVGAADAARSAQTVLASDTAMTNIDVNVDSAPGLVVVTITADAPGIIHGTSRPVSVTVAIPIEEVTPP